MNLNLDLGFLVTKNRRGENCEKNSAPDSDPPVSETIWFSLFWVRIRSGNTDPVVLRGCKLAQEAVGNNGQRTEQWLENRTRGAYKTG